MNAKRFQLIVRSILAIVGAGTAAGMHAAGYQGGVETTVGLDGGTVRDLAGLAVASLAVWYPNLPALWAKITNAARIDAIEQRLAGVESQLADDKPAKPQKGE